MSSNEMIKLNRNKLANQNNEKGISLYLALLVLTILLSIGIAITTLLVGQLRIIKGLGNSVVAFYAADTGIEKSLDELYRGNLPPFTFEGNVGNAQYSVQGFSPGDPNNCPSPQNEFFCIKSVGIYQGVRRSIEVYR